MEELQDRVVVITGAARGMGRAYAEAFLAEGCKVVATDVSWETSGRSYDDAAGFKKQLESNVGALVLNLNVTDDSQIEQAYNATLSAFGTVDVLINNGALRMNNLVPSGRIHVLETKISNWENMFRVNVFGLLRMTQVFVKPMMEKRRGSIIIIAGGARDHNSMEQPYGASKAAVRNLTRSLANALEPFNVAVNAIWPAQPRSSGYDEQVSGRKEMGMATAPPVMVEAMVPLALMMARQEARGGFTGKVLGSLEWNIEHGLGGYEHWSDRGT